MQQVLAFWKAYLLTNQGEKQKKQKKQSRKTGYLIDALQSKMISQREYLVQQLKLIDYKISI